MDLHFQGSTPSSTTPHWSGLLVLQMAFVHQLQNQSTSRQSRNLGNSPTAMKHWVRCCSQTNTWISWLQPASISPITECLMELCFLQCWKWLVSLILSRFSQVVIPTPEDLHNTAFTNENNQDGNNDRDIHLGSADNDGIIDGPTVLAHVKLAWTIHEFLIIHVLL